MYAELHHLGIQVSCVMPTFFRSHVMKHARGTKDAKEMSKLMFGTAKLTPELAVKKVLKKVGDGKFHIIFPSDAKLMFLLKRLFPSLLLRIFSRGEKRKESFRKLLQKNSKEWKMMVKLATIT